MQIMINFLSNALKFSEDNSQILINIRLNELLAKTSEKQIRQRKTSWASIKLETAEEVPKFQLYFINFELEVQDFGCGIPHDRLDNLFINFSKIEANAQRNKFGVGLGLSICKSLIEQMAGSVKVESIVGQGTKFIITFKTSCQVLSKSEMV